MAKPNLRVLKSCSEKALALLQARLLLFDGLFKKKLNRKLKIRIRTASKSKNNPCKEPSQGLI
ncbi:hypothetical protein DWQ65_09535 [Treponema phagedenis]|nr:hypothetical protein C5O78_13780 [Treponema phagedenis]QSI00295.1 hypothetical protein DWQ65_09535 [Treponema phagedenis]